MTEEERTAEIRRFGAKRVERDAELLEANKHKSKGLILAERSGGHFKIPPKTLNYRTDTEVIEALCKLYPDEDKQFICDAVDARRLYRGQYSIVPDPETQIICPKSAGAPWIHVVLCGVNFDNCVWGYKMFDCGMAADCEASISYFIDDESYSLSDDDKPKKSFVRESDWTWTCDVSTDEFHDLLSVLKQPQLNLLKKWANTYEKWSKTEEFKANLGARGQVGEVSMIMGLIKAEETKRMQNATVFARDSVRGG